MEIFKITGHGSRLKMFALDLDGNIWGVWSALVWAGDINLGQSPKMLQIASHKSVCW